MKANGRDPMRDGYLVAAGVWVTGLAAGLVAPGTDVTQFYLNRWPEPYAVINYASGAGFYYSPPVALTFAPLSAFGLPIFAAFLAAAAFAALYGILGRWAWVGLFFPPVWWDLSAGNINTLIGFCAVAGLTRPASWAIPLLSKVTPGVGLLWFGVRREWRKLAVALGVSFAVCTVPLALEPQLWHSWVGSIMSNSLGYAGPGFFTVPIPLVPRLAAAVLLIGWGARLDHRWVLPIGVTLAMPVLWWSALAPLVALAPDIAGLASRHRAARGAPIGESQA